MLPTTKTACNLCIRGSAVLQAFLGQTLLFVSTCSPFRSSMRHKEVTKQEKKLWILQQGVTPEMRLRARLLGLLKQPRCN